ncbi:unnamed protein product [Brassica napus]|uniref:(rape) hypothetical protein n=1 Tax=Brassica napus TaxID=3708 RepID=A0A816UDL6_BRANA|nr:unnamed protein product [Brassica napus]
MSVESLFCFVVLLRFRCYPTGSDSGVAPYFRWSSDFCLWRPCLLLWGWAASFSYASHFS